MKLTDGIHAFTWSDPSANNANAYLIRTGLTVLVDPGHTQFLGRLLQSLRMDGVHEDSIQGVICTHAHPDHVEGLAAFANRPVWTALGLKEEAFLKAAGADFYRMMGMSVPQFRIDALLKEGELILGGEPFQVLETPGHSPGSICLYWPGRKALFTGDVVFELGVGRTDFPGGDGKALIESLERLSRLEVELLLPGHGNPLVGRDRIARNFQTVRETYYGYL
jgi:glyoxylase-like metal-dependent hydrolase (beta-lactamase superfamily II)